MQKSRDFEKFLKKEREKRSIYEQLCNVSEKILPISPGKDLTEKYQDAINFSHMHISPKGAFSFAVVASLLTFITPLLLSLLLGVFTLVVLLLIFVFVAFAFYYLYQYPFHFSTIFRIKASAEMVLAVVYMTISMRVSPNIENAIKFAAKNLSGPLAYDLRQLLWDVYTRVYDNADKALDAFILKWSHENAEFTEALYLLKTSVVESTARREEILDESVNVVLNGTKERMKHYAQELNTPIVVLNALGILLPILGLIFFPLIAVFMSESIKPVFLVLGYNILLPLTVYWMMKTYLDKRPYTFHQPDISKHPQFRKKGLNLSLIASLGISLPLITIGYLFMSSSTELFSFNQLVYSLIIVLGIGAGISTYAILSVHKKLKLREEIVQIESEFAEALFQLGNQLTRGIPLERTIKNISPRIENLKISKFFNKILYNIETFGMTFEQAVFDEKSGAIRDYPSKMIEAIMRAVIQISKRGMNAASKAMITISTYLKDVHSVEESLREMLTEVTSNMNIQAILLAPLSSGIVVALAALIMQMLIGLKGSIEKIYGQLGSGGALGSAGAGVLGSIVNLDQVIPPHNFQLIVGIYLIEVVAITAIFLSIIKNGDESLLKRLTVGKTLMISIAIYAVILLSVYSMLSTFVTVTGL